MLSILGLDASSTMIGWCVYAGAPVDHGEIALRGEYPSESAAVAAAHVAAGLGEI
jgi:hypothetical protein